MEEGIDLTELEVGVGVRGEPSISKRQNQTKQQQSWCYCYCCECLFVLSPQEVPVWSPWLLSPPFSSTTAPTASSVLFLLSPHTHTFPLFDLSFSPQPVSPLCRPRIWGCLVSRGLSWVCVVFAYSVVSALFFLLGLCFLSFWSL